MFCSTYHRPNVHSFLTLLHTFSGPVNSNCGLDSEVIALIHMFNLVWRNGLLNNIVQICLDWTEAIEKIRSGLHFWARAEFDGTPVKDMVDKAFTLCYVPRDLNGDADLSAKSGISRPFFVYY